MNTITTAAPVNSDQRVDEIFDEAQTINGLIWIGRTWDPEIGMWWPRLYRSPEEIAESTRLNNRAQKPSLTAAELDERCDEVHKANELNRNSK